MSEATVKSRGLAVGGVPLAVAVVAASCASVSSAPNVGRAERDGAPADAALTLGCATSYGIPRLTGSRRFDVVVGPVRLVNVRVVARQPRRWMEPSRGRDFTRKIPLVVEAGAPVRIEIPEADRQHVSLVYERDRLDTRRVSAGEGALRFEPCDNPRGSWWSGGIRVDGPRCVRLGVRGDGARRIARLPFGRGTCRVQVG